jgi:hypothetical protein
MSMTRKGMKMRKPIWKAALQLAGDEGRHQHAQRHALGLQSAGSLASFDEELHVGLARLLEHELRASAPGRVFQRLVEGDLVLRERLVGLGVDLVERGRHDEEGEEQRQPHDAPGWAARWACRWPGAAATAR